MIIKLKGTLSQKSNGWAIIENAGLGYQVHLSSELLAELQGGCAVDLWIYEHVREDIHDLYGFQNERERKLFLQVLDVSGVGPKMALNILSLGKLEVIERKIDEGDVEWISRVPGVGKKTAQKIILELRGKLSDIGDGDSTSEEVVSALMNLGYSREQARHASSGIEGQSVEEKLKSALKSLAK